MLIFGGFHAYFLAKSELAHAYKSHAYKKKACMYAYIVYYLEPNLLHEANFVTSKSTNMVVIGCRGTSTLIYK